MPSSVVASYHYNAHNTILTVVFVSGMVYEYKGVPESIYMAMKATKSKGQYLNNYIKGHFPFEQVS